MQNPPNITDSSLSAVKKPKLLDQMRTLMRIRHYAYKTEESYTYWCLKYFRFHQMKHPRTVGPIGIPYFLKYLAVDRNVSAKTQNQALNALVFLYREVLKVDIGDITTYVRARATKRIPVVLTRNETLKLLGAIKAEYKLIVTLLYGSGMRLMEVLRLRVKDVDFEKNIIIVREGKGDKDRVVMLPKKIKGGIFMNLLFSARSAMQLTYLKSINRLGPTHSAIHLQPTCSNPGPISARCRSFWATSMCRPR